MGLIKNVVAGMALGVAFSLPVWAENRVAVIIANEDYKAYRDVPEATDLFALSRALRADGFSISAHRNLDAASMRKVVARIAAQLGEGDRLVVAVAGHVVSSQRDAWLFAVDANQSTALGAGLQGLSLGELADMMDHAAGSAVLLVGEARRPLNAQGGLSAGVGELELPQGVTAFASSPAQLVRWADRQLFRDGISLQAALDAAPSSIRGFGYLSSTTAFLDEETSRGIPGVSAADLDDFFFTRAKTAGTQAALQDYVDRYPNGRHTPAAQKMIADLSRSPVDIARDEEQAMRLTRSDKRNIQEDLSLLGFSTNGVDGIFGNGTRNAVRRWERAEGLEVTGYLNEADLERLAAAAAAERKKVEREDAAFWRSTGRLGTETGYRAYLKRYPQGLFADLAREELAVIEDERRDAQALEEQDAWDVARAKDSISDYQAFLAEFPDGANAAEAEARLAELQGASAQDTIDAARQVEIQLLANPITRVLVERRLAQLGYKPGKIDGKMNNETRAAVRKFQQRSGLPVTGYFDAKGLSVLLSN